jgi:hypothetical protein
MAGGQRIVRGVWIALAYRFQLQMPPDLHGQT